MKLTGKCKFHDLIRPVIDSGFFIFYNVVYMLGQGNERVGFKWFALVVAILFFVFILITCINIKEKSTVDVEAPSVGQMFRSLLQNDQAMTVVVTIVLINCSIYITSNLVINIGIARRKCMLFHQSVYGWMNFSSII